MGAGSVLLSPSRLLCRRQTGRRGPALMAARRAPPPRPPAPTPPPRPRPRRVAEAEAKAPPPVRAPSSPKAAPAPPKRAPALPKRPPAHLITRAEMARKLGVSRAAVTQACREGGRLFPACEGAAVNLLHDAARRWLIEREGARLELPPLPPIAVDEDPPEAPRPVEALEAELGPREQVDLADLAEPLTMLTEKYCDVREFESWIRARKALEEARKAEMLRERIEQRLIARTTVVRMIEHIDTAFRLLLSDAPRAIATRIAPQEVAHVAALVRDVMRQHLEACRQKMDQSLEHDDPMAPLAEAAE